MQSNRDQMKFYLHKLPLKNFGSPFLRDRTVIARFYLPRMSSPEPLKKQPSSSGIQPSSHLEWQDKQISAGFYAAKGLIWFKS